jgi:hypothetical protein
LRLAAIGHSLDADVQRPDLFFLQGGSTMSKWWWRADYVETCNCAHGCPCNFTMIPTHGGCHGIDAYHIREGECDGVRLDGLNVAFAFAWPGPIHHGHGHGIVYVDERANAAQRAALERIAAGEAGPGGPFEIFRSTFDERPPVVVGPLQFSVDGRRARIGLGDVGGVDVGPVLSDMDGSEANARLVMPDGFIFKDGMVVNVEHGWVHGPGLDFDYGGSSAFIAEVAYNT